MSGGVDSSVAAFLLKEAGWRVIGMSLRTWPPEFCDTLPKGQICCSAQDAEDARGIASQLDIPFRVVDAVEPFKRHVADYFVAAYAKGLTPNPCIVCNRAVKCSILLDEARALGAEYVATGHYARVVRDETCGRYTLAQAKDLDKDQSYALYQLTQDQLARLLLPVGAYTKTETRALAAEAGFSVADKPESMELCFIPNGDTQAFLRDRVPHAFVPGSIVDRTGRVLGSHTGIAGYTVGQRKRLGVYRASPLYVLEIRPDSHEVVVGEAEALATDSCQVQGITWMGIEGLRGPRTASVKVRYRSAKHAAQLVPQGERVEVRFLDPVCDGVAPGQAAVFYEGDRVLGGGWITQRSSTPSQQ